MKILFLGDIVGKKGREVIRDLLASLKEKYNADIVVANGENSAHGKGITIKIYNELLSYGIDYITMGNHTFSKKEVIEHLDEMDRLICPINHINMQGTGYRVVTVNDEKLCIVNCLGEVTQESYTTSPFIAMNEVLEFTDDVDYYLVDLHAEATAEKRVFAEYYSNVVTAVLGTHTHVQTADEQIINGMGFITDVGMCGPFNSIIGRDIDECINRMVHKETTRYTISDNDPILCGIFLEFKDKKCIKIERIQIRP